MKSQLQEQIYAQDWMSSSDLINWLFVNETMQMILIMFFGFVLCGIICVISLVVGDRKEFNKPEDTYPYKRGQIDALNGKILFEKVENEDKEIKWKHIEIKK